MGHSVAIFGANGRTGSKLLAAVLESRWSAACATSQDGHHGRGIAEPGGHLSGSIGL